MTKKITIKNFEQARSELESLVEKLEQGELSLEESLNAFERGMMLAKGCQEALEVAEQRIDLLTGRMEPTNDE